MWIVGFNIENIVGCIIENIVENIVGRNIENIVENIVGCNIENGKLVGQTKERTWDWTTNKQIEKYCPFTKPQFRAAPKQRKEQKAENLPKTIGDISGKYFANTLNVAKVTI